MEKLQISRTLMSTPPRFNFHGSVKFTPVYELIIFLTISNLHKPCALSNCTIVTTVATKVNIITFEPAKIDLVVAILISNLICKFMSFYVATSSNFGVL